MMRLGVGMFGLRASFRAAAAPSATLPASFSTSNASFDKDNQVIGVIGLGLMGHGITQLVASSGYQVKALDINDQAIETGMGRIKGSLQKVYKKKFENPEDAENAFNKTLGLIHPTTNYSDFSDCDLVIEAATENLPLKHKVFSSLNDVAKPSCIFCSNTSSLSVSEIAEGTGRPDKTVGLHFFNPVQIMKLVEVIKGDKTDAGVYESSYEFVKELRKIPVKCTDTPGFIVNRLLVPSLCQAILLYERGDATIVDIDNGMKFGAGHPMGPILLADYVGLDTVLFILEGWVKNFPNEPAFLIPESLREKVKSGKFGRKSGEGFYKWDGDKPLGPA